MDAGGDAVEPAVRAPALERGLVMLEALVSAPDGLPFSQLLAVSGAPKATAARLLRVLRASGYVSRDRAGGRYTVGPRMAVFAGSVSVPELLRAECDPVLSDLAARTGNTVLLVYLRGLQLECLAKCLHEESLVLQEVGRVEPFFLRPWGVLFYDQLTDAEKARVRPRLPAWFMPFLREQRMVGGGFVCEGGGDRSATMLRLAAPIIGPAGRRVAALCLGGTPVSLPRDRVEAVGRLLAEAASRVGTALGWCRERPDPAP